MNFFETCRHRDTLKGVALVKKMAGERGLVFRRKGRELHMCSSSYTKEGVEEETRKQEQGKGHGPLDQESSRSAHCSVFEDGSFQSHPAVKPKKLGWWGCLPGSPSDPRCPAAPLAHGVVSWNYKHFCANVLTLHLK